MERENNYTPGYTSRVWWEVYNLGIPQGGRRCITWVYLRVVIGVHTVVYPGVRGVPRVVYPGVYLRESGIYQGVP